MIAIALLLCVSGIQPHPAATNEDPVLRVFILAGQSNMQGQGVVDLDHPDHYNGGKGTLVHAMKEPANAQRYKHVRNDDGTWNTRDDVFVRFKTSHSLKKGPLGIGYSGYPGKHHIGPEFQFGHVVGQHFDEPVLLIKTAWGGKSLHKDFRPPSSGGETGPYYTQMLAEINEGLTNLSADFPQLKNRRPVIAGFAWMQGWNDMVDKEATAEYEQNLVNFVKDVRRDLKQPDLPFVVGELGNGGENASAGMLTFRKAQAAACKRKEIGQHIVFVPTAKFARPAQESPNVGHGHHWFGNAESYFLIGDALGTAMLAQVPKKK